MNFEKESKAPWEVKRSDALLENDISRLLNSGETIKFIVTEAWDIILGSGMHEGIAKENGLTYDDIGVVGQFKLEEGKLRWGYPDVRERKTIIEEKIEEYLKNKGVI